MLEIKHFVYDCVLLKLKNNYKINEEKIRINKELFELCNTRDFKALE